MNFGHSCYGGMGKRASDLIDTNEEVLQNVEDVEENPAFVFTGPRSSYKPKPDRLTQQQYDNISRIVRQWVRIFPDNTRQKANINGWFGINYQN